MRGSDETTGSLFSYVDIEQRIPTKHPLRLIRDLVNDVLTTLDAEFEALYEGTGRQSIAPERLLRASLLQAFYSVRSEQPLSSASIKPAPPTLTQTLIPVHGRLKRRPW
jgi:transposase